MEESPARKNVVILGSTGSVGTSTLEVLRHMPERFRVVGLSAGSRWHMLAEQSREFHPHAVALVDGRRREEFEAAIDAGSTEALYGEEGLCALAGLPEADIVVSAVSGAVGLPAAIAALRQGCRLALANKEALVIGGELLMALARRQDAEIIPVDSEHSAIFQALRSGRPQEVERIVITASGGPCYRLSEKERDAVTPEQALNHPTWQMGKKITIDSATLMNKALEIIEARWLFGLPPDKIKVLIHPQSVVHSLVEFVDGSVLAQLGAPDMRLPIQYALTFPERIPGPAGKLKLTDVAKLEFEEPDLTRFPALALGYRVAECGGTAGAALNAANEVAVGAFLDGRIRLTDIVRCVGAVLERHTVRQSPALEDILAADAWAREEAKKCLARSST